MPVTPSREILSIRGLKVCYATDQGTVSAVRGVDLTAAEGEIVGLVGESGCGKSATLLSVMQLLPIPGKAVAGSVLVDGKDVMSLRDKDLRAMRGKVMAMVFQDPMSTLNPSHRVGQQLREAMKVHGESPNDGVLVSLLEEVGIPSPKAVLGYYPHQLSGGMQQRVMIAIALACGPKLILADEPTTALDVTIEAQILDLLRKVNRDTGAAIVLVTHNLAVASQFCHRIAVMYAGQIVEEGPVEEVLARPLHPYTKGLIGCIPRFKKGAPLTPIPGQVPDLAQSHTGCSFYPRCTRGIADCGMPPGQELLQVGSRLVRCNRWNLAEHGDVAAAGDMGWPDWR